MKKSIKKIFAALLAGIMIIGSCGVVFAENEDAQRAEFIKMVVEHLSIYARYDEVSQASLYKSALLEIAEKYPDMYEPIMKGLLESIDEHSEYYNKEEAALLMEQITGEIIGIGITFQMCSSGVEVVSVVRDTPAEKAGIEVGDIIVSADGNDLAGMNSDTAATYIRGAEGTAVRVGVKRKGVASTIYFDIIREKITGTSIEHKSFKDGDKELMYIAVYGFVSNTAEEFEKALMLADAAGVENIIIDLRDNGGGIFEQAIEMARCLLPEGAKITTEDRKMKMLNVTYTSDNKNPFEFNTVVLINENSASASEVLAAALAENEKATLIGKKSYGKGTIQTVMNLVGEDMIKYTTGYYLTPLGNNINGKGIAPHNSVENDLVPFDIENYEKFGALGVYIEGDVSPEIKNAKALLKAWGTFDGEINENFDHELFEAIYKFQNATGLFPYGALDLTTQHELYTRMSLSKVVKDNQLTSAFAHFGMKME